MIKFCSENFVIRNIESKDKDAVFRICNDNLVKEYVPSYYCETATEVKELMKTFVKGDCKNDFYLIVYFNRRKVALLAANRIVKNSLDVSLIVDFKFRQRGFSVEIMKAFKKWLKENTDYEYLTLIIQKTNINSLESAKKLNSYIMLETETYFEHRIYIHGT